MGIEYFCCYHSYLEVMEQLNDAEKGRLFTACLTYSKTGEVPQLSGNERFVFPTFKAQIDRDNAKYQEKCRKQSENIKKRWNTSEYQSIPTDTTVYHRIPTIPRQRKRQRKRQIQRKILPPYPPHGGNRRSVRGMFLPVCLSRCGRSCGSGWTTSGSAGRATSPPGCPLWSPRRPGRRQSTGNRP